MGFPKCDGCSWCCVFIGPKGKQKRPVLSREDRARIAAKHGRAWDKENRIQTGPDGLCVLYEKSRGCRLQRDERPFDCLLYPFIRTGREDYRVDFACPEIQRLLKEMVRENAEKLDKDMAFTNRKAAACRKKGARVKKRRE